MDKEVDFNGRLRLRVVLNTEMLRKTDPGIAPQKRLAYESLPQSTIPYIASETDVQGTNRGMRELVKFVSLEPFLTGTEGKVVLFHILVTCKEDGIYNYFLRPPLSPISRGLYLPDGVWNADYRRLLIKRIETALKEWKALKTLELLNKEVASLLVRRSKTIFLNLRVAHWASYVNQCLFREKTSRLFGFDPVERRERFLFLAIDPYDEKQEWPLKLARYREANPLPTTVEEAAELTESGTSLPNLPFDNHLLHGQYISMAVLDTRNQNAMAGYVTCSVKAIGPSNVVRLFKSEALNQLRRRLDKEGVREDCGYDEFSIDGLHVSKSHTGLNLAKALFFYAVEFIRNSHQTLGVTLLSAGSEAAATKSILTRFGYLHYNRINALKWLIMAWEDYYTQEAPLYPLDLVISYKNHGTPQTFLTLVKLVGEMELFHKLYLLAPYDESPASLRVRDSVRSLIALYSQYRDALASSESVENFHQTTIEMLERIPSTVEKLRAYGAEIDPLKADGTPRSTGYMADVRRFLGSGFDDHDTFLYIGDQEGRDRMTASSQPFLEEYLKGGLGRVEEGDNDGRQTGVVKSVLQEEVEESEDRRYEPTIGDLSLYDEWLVVEPLKRRIVEETRPRHLVINLVSESEEEVEEAKRSLLSSNERLKQEILLHESEVARLRKLLEENEKAMQQLF